MSSNKFIFLAVEEGIATITINNPPGNFLSIPALQELDVVLDSVAQDNAIKVIIFTGNGTFFIAGADIKEIAVISSSSQGEELAVKGQLVLNKIEKMGKPFIAAINGACLGGGMELAMACHMRIASDRARLGQPEINLGIIPGFGGTQRLSRIAGIAKAIEMILTGDVITAEEAKSIGLVNKVVPDGEVLKYALSLAKKITSKGQIAVRNSLKAITEGYNLSLDEGLSLEAKQFSNVCKTEDMKEGLKAFLEKRQPKFMDR